MGWQEEEVAKLRAAQEKMCRQNESTAKVVYAFWQKICEVNDSLLPELRMALEERNYPYGKDLFLSFRGGYIQFGSYKFNDRPDSYFVNIGVSSKKLTIYPDSNNILVGCVTVPPDEPYMNETNIYFCIDSSTPDVLVKNVITGTGVPWAGLTEKDYNPKTCAPYTMLEKIQKIFR